MTRLDLELDVTTDEVTASRVAGALEGRKPTPPQPSIPAQCRGCGIAQLIPDPGDGILAWRCWCGAITEARCVGPHTKRRVELRLKDGEWPD